MLDNFVLPKLIFTVLIIIPQIILPTLVNENWRPLKFLFLQKANNASYLYIDDGSKLAEVLIEFCDIVELTWDLAHLQLRVHIVIPLGKTALMLVVEVRPKNREIECMMTKAFFLNRK